MNRIKLVKSLFLIGLLLSSCFFNSCGGEEDNDSVIQTFLTTNGINANQTLSGLYYEINTPGSGVEVMSSDFVKIDITQFDLENNRIGGSAGSDFPVAISVDRLLTGLREGLQLLKKGARAVFVIPPELSGGVITSGALVYGVEILDIYESLEQYNDREIETYLADNGLSADRNDNGMYVIIEEEGMDARPTISSNVTVDYHGYFLNGQVFDSSRDRGSPSSFNLSGVIEGWQLGIPLFATGGKGTLFIPSNLAYGEQGFNGIPGNYPLVFEVEVVSVNE